MAEGNEWCGKLNNCPVFDVLRKSASKLKEITQAKSMLAIHNGKLYVWDSYSASLLATNLKSSQWSTYQVKSVSCDWL